MDGAVATLDRLGIAVFAVFAASCASGVVAPVPAPSAPPIEAPTPLATATVPASTTAPVATVAVAPPPPAADSPAREVDRGSLDRRELALTFDCGGTAEGTAEILAALREADVHVTFFMIGDWVRAHPALAREIAERHEIASHSDTHPDYRDLTDEQIVADLDASDRTFRDVLGRSARPMWRAPSGARDDRVLAAAAKGGWPLHVFWTLARDAQGLVSGDSGDWRDIPPREVAENLRRAAALGNGVIAVSHCDSAQTRLLMPEVLRALRGQGLRVTTVSDLLR